MKQTTKEIRNVPYQIWHRSSKGRRTGGSPAHGFSRVDDPTSGLHDHDQLQVSNASRCAHRHTTQNADLMSAYVCPPRLSYAVIERRAVKRAP